MAEHDQATKVDEPEEAVGCYVDWGWLEGMEIASVTSDLTHFRIRFTNGQTLTIQASNYKGEPFLAFDPYKPAE